jgi:hypothetical protein
MVESFNRKMEHECNIGNLPSIKVVRGVKRINHSQFVDDTILLGGASTIMENKFKNVL